MSQQQDEDNQSLHEEEQDNPGLHEETQVTSQSEDTEEYKDKDVDQHFSQHHFEAVEPENFDTQSFFSNIDALSTKLCSDSLRSFDLDSEIFADDLKSTITAVTVSMENFKHYSLHSQAQLEKLRDQIKEVKDRMYRKQSQHPYDSDKRMTFEEQELEVKLQNLNKELSKTTEELVKAQQVSAESEVAATQAALVAAEAAKEAKQIQEEYEHRRKAELEKRQREEELQRREKEEQERLVRIQKEQEEAEAHRKAKLRREEQKAPEWQQWPVFKYEIEGGHFDHGIGCFIRGNPNCFKETMVSCKLVQPLEAEYVYEENEELVSNIIQLEAQEELQESVYVVVPHCTSRSSAMTREPIIKSLTSEGWVQLKSQEVSLPEYKDLKFVQAEVMECGQLAVVTRYKTDYLTFSKRGGTVHSNVDQRIAFTAPTGSFVTKEHFTVQIQPIDSATVNEIRTHMKPMGNVLLATSAFISCEWSASEFLQPITFTVPVPPNPVKAKKAAAARAEKEAKMKNTQPTVVLQNMEDDKNRKKEKRIARNARGKVAANVEEEDQVVTKKPTKWYMGQYGVQEEDENDILFLVYKDKRGKWQCDETVNIQQIRIDLVECHITEPSKTEKFLLLRMKPTAEVTEALQLTGNLEKKLRERTINVILKQKNENSCLAMLEVIHSSKADRAVERMSRAGYEDGPPISSLITIKEGQRLAVTFRSNIKGVNEDSIMDMIFNSQLSNTIELELSEVNRYLQKNQNTYMGYVQLMQKTPVLCIRKPQKESKSKSKKPEVEPDENEEEQIAEEEQTYIEFETKILAELLVTIPKEQEFLEPVTIKKAPLTLRNQDDVVNKDTLRLIATELGSEWQRVSYHLNVRKTRIQAILRNIMAQDRGEDDAKYEMLMNWAKKVPKSVNKVETLRSALIYAGREDLADDLKDKDENFQRQRKGRASPAHQNY